MINYVKQDITLITTGVVAHGCNTQGVMGAGVARFLRTKHPSIFPQYAKICKEQDEVQLLGSVDFRIISPTLVIANCFTQHLGKLINGKIACPIAIDASLNSTLKLATLLKLPGYLPKIGCGLGGLDWETDVEPILNYLVSYYSEVPIYVCVWP